MPKFITPVADFFLGRAKPIPPTAEELAYAERLGRKLQEKEEREKAAAESVRFREALADFVIKTLGVASEMTADEAPENIRGILAHGGAAKFLQEAREELVRRSATVEGAIPDDGHLSACLGSPMVAEIVKIRLRLVVDAIPLSDLDETREIMPGSKRSA